MKKKRKLIPKIPKINITLDTFKLYYEDIKQRRHKK